MKVETKVLTVGETDLNGRTYTEESLKAMADKSKKGKLVFKDNALYVIDTIDDEDDSGNR